MNKPLQHFPSLCSASLFPSQIASLRERYKTKSTYLLLSNGLLLPFRSFSWAETGREEEKEWGGHDFASHYSSMPYHTHSSSSDSQPFESRASVAASKELVQASKRHAHGTRKETQGRASSKAHSAWNLTRFSRPSFAWSARVLAPRRRPLSLFLSSYTSHQPVFPRPISLAFLRLCLALGPLNTKGLWFIQ